MSFKIDELQWSEPETANEMQGIHSNSVLYYFMRSPYFDKTSNNNTVYNQAMHNHDMFPILETREKFEDFLKSMSGVEYIVHQAPAEMAPGTGTGVWVIRKQLRRKRNDGQPDDLTVYADYFVVGYNIYQAPTLADVLSSRITSMAVALGKAFPAMNSMQTWSPAEGHYYETMGKAAAKEAGENGFVEGGQTLEDEDEEDADDDSEDSEDSSDEDAMDIDKKEKTTTEKTNGDGDGDNSSEYDSDDDAVLDPRLAEESYAIHMMYGGEYMDEQPISGRPGDFHIALAGGGRSAVGGAAGAANGKAAAASAAATTEKTDGSKDGTGSGKATPKDGKESGKKSGATTPKPKRRKSKGPAAA